MGWFRKEDKKKENVEPNLRAGQLPEFPELPELPPLIESGIGKISSGTKKEGLPPLPTFPQSSFGDKIAQQALKQAIKEPEEPDEAELFNREDILSREMPVHDIFSMHDSSFEKPNKPRENGSVFVRIDKYQEALLNFQDVKKQISEIENLLKGIKELRQREERELAEWENEIKQAKEKLAGIDSSLFKKVEV